MQSCAHGPLEHTFGELRGRWTAAVAWWLHFMSLALHFHVHVSAQRMFLWATCPSTVMTSLQMIFAHFCTCVSARLCRHVPARTG